MPSLPAPPVFFWPSKQGGGLNSSRSGRPLPFSLLFWLAVLFAVASCTSLDYVSGIYEQSPDQQVNVLVRVTDRQGLALTDLALNDFYVWHNEQPLERSNRLYLNETFSAVRLYLTVLIDLRQNPEQKNSFERMRGALKAYLTLQPDNMYIKLISYDEQARALHSEFSNDKDMLQDLLKDLEEVQTTDSALEQALALAHKSIAALPYGPYVLDPQSFVSKEIQGTAPVQSPLYNSAILLLNHNVIATESLQGYQSIATYMQANNFVVLDSTGEFRNTVYLVPTKISETPADNDMAKIFKVYELPPQDLNKDVNQSKAVELVDLAWDALSNIVNGYYWLSYSKYTDMAKEGRDTVRVSLTQYGRSKDDGYLVDYAQQAPSTVDSTVDTMAAAVPATDWQPEAPEAPESEAQGSELAMLPPGLVAEETAADPNLAEPAWEAKEPNETDNWLAMLPGVVDEELHSSFVASSTPVLPSLVEARPAATLASRKQNFAEDFPLVTQTSPPETSPAPSPEISETVISDFDILSNLGNESPDSYLVRSTAAPQFTAEPIQLVSAEPAQTLVEPPPSQPPKIATFSNGRYIQVGAFAKLDNLYNLMAELDGRYDVRAVTSTVKGKKYQRCIVGPFASPAETQEAVKELHTSGLADAFVISKPIEAWLGE